MPVQTATSVHHFCSGCAGCSDCSVVPTLAHALNNRSSHRRPEPSGGRNRSSDSTSRSPATASISARVRVQGGSARVVLVVGARRLDHQGPATRGEQRPDAGRRLLPQRRVQRLDGVDLDDQVEGADQVVVEVEQVALAVVDGRVRVALAHGGDRGGRDVEGGGGPALRGQVLGVAAEPAADDDGPAPGARAELGGRAPRGAGGASVRSHGRGDVAARAGRPQLVVPAGRVAVRDRGDAQLVGQLVPGAVPRVMAITAGPTPRRSPPRARAAARTPSRRCSWRSCAPRCARGWR